MAGKRNVHITLSREDAEKLWAGEVTESTATETAEAIAQAEKLERAVEEAHQLDEEDKLDSVDVGEAGPRDDHLRVICREPTGKERRCSVFVPLPPDSGALVDALRVASPAFTAYTLDEARRTLGDK